MKHDRATANRAVFDIICAASRWISQRDPILTTIWTGDPFLDKLHDLTGDPSGWQRDIINVISIRAKHLERRVIRVRTITACQLN